MVYQGCLQNSHANDKVKILSSDQVIARPIPYTPLIVEAVAQNDEDPSSNQSKPEFRVNIKLNIGAKLGAYHPINR
jgi:hypothetical protein